MAGTTANELGPRPHQHADLEAEIVVDGAFAMPAANADVLFDRLPKTTFPLWMYVVTLVWPSPATRASRSFILILFRTPTLTPRSIAT